MGLCADEARLRADGGRRGGCDGKWGRDAAARTTRLRARGRLLASRRPSRRQTPQLGSANGGRGVQGKEARRPTPQACRPSRTLLDACCLGSKYTHGPRAQPHGVLVLGPAGPVRPQNSQTPSSHRTTPPSSHAAAPAVTGARGAGTPAVPELLLPLADDPPVIPA